MTDNAWRNRIVGHGSKPADQFQANPGNFRTHPKHQQRAVKASLNTLGWVGVVVENIRTGNLVDGHERVWQALQADNAEVPYIQVDLSPEEEAQALLSLDPMAALAGTDSAAMDALLRQIQTDNADLSEFLVGLAEDNGLIYGEQIDPQDDPGAQIDRAEELREKWQVQTGQLWQLGSHRIICGDCTDAAVFERLMGEDNAEMVWTDPPYGVAVEDKNKFLNSIAPSNRVEENLENDTLDEAGLESMLALSFDNTIRHCAAGAGWYVAAPPGPLHVLFGLALKERGIWRQTIQWVKNNSTFSPMGVCYHWQAEPIVFGWLPGGGHRWHGGRKQTTVWNIDRPMKSPEHPTMKPVELVERALENSSLLGEIALDPFLGSGTTLVAAERLGRVCRGIEISPAYIAVTLERWSEMSGQQPERL
jgi:DNA modification methylase